MLFVYLCRLLFPYAGISRIPNHQCSLLLVVVVVVLHWLLSCLCTQARFLSLWSLCLRPKPSGARSHVLSLPVLTCRQSHPQERLDICFHSRIDSDARMTKRPRVCCHSDDVGVSLADASHSLTALPYLDHHGRYCRRNHHGGCFSGVYEQQQQQHIHCCYCSQLSSPNDNPPRLGRDSSRRPKSRPTFTPRHHGGSS